MRYLFYRSKQQLPARSHRQQFRTITEPTLQMHMRGIRVVRHQPIGRIPRLLEQPVGRNKCFSRIAPHVPALGRFIDIRRNALRLLRPTIFLYHAPLPQLLLKLHPCMGWAGAGQRDDLNGCAQLFGDMTFK